MSRSTVMDGLQELITKFNGLTLDQQAVFLDLVDPLDEHKPKAKKPRKGSGKRRGLGNNPLGKAEIAEDGNGVPQSYNL